MKKMKWLALVLMLAVGLLAGCNDDTQSGNVGTGEVNRLAEVVSLTEEETADLQVGEVADIEVTPELKLCFWETGNMDMWAHLPEFAEGEQPTDVSAYWFMVLTDDVIGLDEAGWLVRDDRWAEVPVGSEYGWPGCAMIAKADVDDFVYAHFGDVQLNHGESVPKIYDFDGKTYYGQMDGGLPKGLFGLRELTAEKREDGKVVYTARLWEYVDGAYDGRTRDALAAEYGDVEDLNVYKAMTEMLLAGKTDDFAVDKDLTVKFYIDGDTGDTVYLAVDWRQLYGND